MFLACCLCQSISASLCFSFMLCVVHLGFKSFSVFLSDFTRRKHPSIYADLRRFHSFLFWFNNHSGNCLRQKTCLKKEVKKMFSFPSPHAVWIQLRLRHQYWPSCIFYSLHHLTKGPTTNFTNPVRSGPQTKVTRGVWCFRENLNQT